MFSSFNPSTHSTVCLSIHLPILLLDIHYQPAHLAIYLCIYSSTCPSICLSIHPSPYLLTHHLPIIYPIFLTLSICLSTYSAIHAPVFFFQIAIYLPIHLPRPPLPTLIHLIATRMEGGWNRYEGPVLLALARVPRMCGPGTVEWGPDGSVEERWGLRRGSGQGRRNGKRRRGEDGHFSWGPEELVKRCVPQAGEGKGRVRTTPEQGKQGLWAAHLA